MLNAIASELQPAGSSPYFGVLLYGAASTVETIAVLPTTSAATIKAKLDLKQYTAAQVNPCKLSSALDLVDTLCQSACRTSASRVTIIFTSSPDSLAEFRVRQLERTCGMTVIAVGIGALAQTATLNNLATYPSRLYAVPFNTFTDLIVTTPYLSDLISNVPRLLSVGSTLSVSSTISGTYYTVQLNTYGYIHTNDTVVTYTTNWSSRVFASLSEPNPTLTNAIETTNSQYMYASGYYRTHYFRIPTNADRFYVSFLGTGGSSLTGRLDVFNMPSMMTFPATTKSV